jgi:hypothetical protein
MGIPATPAFIPDQSPALSEAQKRLALIGALNNGWSLAQGLVRFDRDDAGAQHGWRAERSGGSAAAMALPLGGRGSKKETRKKASTRRKARSGRRKGRTRAGK